MKDNTCLTKKVHLILEKWSKDPYLNVLYILFVIDLWYYIYYVQYIYYKMNNNMTRAFIKFFLLTFQDIGDIFTRICIIH